MSEDHTERLEAAPGGTYLLSERQEPEMAPGDFPFPISKGSTESPYLTWLRNHSNYMVARGLLDWLRAIGVLVRGVVLNLLILLPVLLLIAGGVAGYHVLLESPDTPLVRLLAGIGTERSALRGFLGALLAPPYPLTKLLLTLGLGYALLTAVLTPYAKELSYLYAASVPLRRKQGGWTGENRAFKWRDRYERSFGAALIGLLAVGGLESLVYFLPSFHARLFESGIGLPQVTSVVALLVGVLSYANTLLSKLGQIAKGLALTAIGILSVLVLLLMVLLVADFLVYAHPREWHAQVIWVTFGVLAVSGGFLLLLISFHGFKRNGRLVVGLFLLMCVGIVAYVEFEYRTGSGFDDKLDAVVSLPVFREEVDEVVDHLLRSRKSELHRLVSDLGKEPGWLVDLRSADDPPPEGVYRYLPQEARDLRGDTIARREYAKKLGRLLASESDTAIQRRARWHVVRALGLASVADSLFAADTLSPGDALRQKARADSLDIEWYGGLDCWRGYRPSFFAVEWRNADARKRADSLTGLFDFACRLKEVRLEMGAEASYSGTRYPRLYRTPQAEELRRATFPRKVLTVLLFGGLVFVFCWFSVDVNLTSIHGLYRDRLAAAYLVGKDADGQIGVEEDLALSEICRHEEGSVAPYHLINVALNLQGTKDVSVRDRRSGFFLFSKGFVGGDATGYCTTESMVEVFPQVTLATAMAISAGAASPNMGRFTSRGLGTMMTLLNVRLGYWLPNPGLLQAKKTPPRITFPEVFARELEEVEARWDNVYPDSTERKQRRLHAADGTPTQTETTRHGLVGLGFSGGGIRSATFNLGITQALDRAGVFAHVDYMSTVSGGGYLGSSITAAMRDRTQKRKVAVEVSGSKVRRFLFGAHDDGTARTWAERPKPSTRKMLWEGWFAAARAAGVPVAEVSNFSDRFGWRVRPSALLREMLGKLDEKSRWVNVSDGGHIENLAAIELLRRRCQYIIIGDGEADKDHHFNGLATLIRTARIDLGVHIDIELRDLRLDTAGLSKGHWAIGRVGFPGEDEEDRGYLLYLKPSLLGDEDEVIKEFRSANPDFPHESTADQFFSEGQFEAYRSLGQHIGERVLSCEVPGDTGKQRSPGAHDGKMDYAAIEKWFAELDRRAGPERMREEARSA